MATADESREKRRHYRISDASEAALGAFPAPVGARRHPGGHGRRPGPTGVGRDATRASKLRRRAMVAELLAQFEL